jgi:hypothetical protein
LKRFTGLHIAFKEILLQCKNAKYKDDDHRDEHQVIIVVDINMHREFSSQRQPDIKKLSQLIVEVIKYGQKEEYGNKTYHTGYPFAPIKWPENDQRNPYYKEHVYKGQVNHGAYSYDHSKIIGN